MSLESIQAHVNMVFGPELFIKRLIVDSFPILWLIVDSTPFYDSDSDLRAFPFSSSFCYLPCCVFADLLWYQDCVVFPSPHCDGPLALSLAS